MKFPDKVKKYYLFLLVPLVLFLLNHNFQSTYVGLDNISPFWGFDNILAQITHSENYFTFGPILFSWWFGFLNILGISASFISSIYVWGYLMLAASGYYLLSKKILETTQEHNPLYFLMAFFSSLTVLWIFSTHELMFMSIFTSFPYLLLALLNWEAFSKQKKIGFNLIILPMFFSSSINISVFFFGFALLLIYALSFSKNGQKKEIIKRSIIIALLFLLSTQVLIFITRGSEFILQELFTHVNIVQKSTNMGIITTDLSMGEIHSASITSALRFSTGWLNIYDENSESVYNWGPTIQNSYFIAILQVFVILISIKILFKSNPSLAKKLIPFFLIWLTIMTPLGLSIVHQIPIIGEALRSTSTKLWPLFFVPYIITVTNTAIYLNTKTKLFPKLMEGRILGVLFLIILVTISFPWITGNVYNNNTAPIIPQEYEEFYGKLSIDDTILVLPDPQVLYFRKYQWGYYGSDLVSYMTKAKVTNAGSIMPFQENENSLSCESINSTKLKYSYIVFEKPFSCPNLEMDFTEYNNFLVSSIIQ